MLRHFLAAVLTANSPTSPTSPELNLHDTMQHSLLRAFFAIASLVATLGLAFVLLSGEGLQPEAQWARVAANATLALGFGLCLRLSRDRILGMLAPLVLLAPVLMAAVGLATGWGLQTPGLVLLSLLVLLANAVGSARVGWASMLASVAATVVLAAAERSGWLPQPSGVPPFSSRLVVLCASIAAGALMGRGLARLLRQHLQAADAREQRFRALLGIAASAYWETDPALRLSHLSRRDAAGHFAPLPGPIGHLLWDVPGLQLDEDSIDLLRAELESRASFRDLGFGWQPSSGQQHFYLASGEPRFDTQGHFIGYWGVARDVTGEHRARLALASTGAVQRAAAEALARSQSLLARVVTLSPDIITLTDLQSGRYVMVNDSFCRLLGHQQAEVEGRSSIELGVWHDPADRQSLVQSIAENGAVQDRLIRFVTRSGQVLALLMSGIRFESDGQHYLLLNGRDVSEASRVRQEREAILANASVGIAFSRDHHIVMANAQFEQIYGWPPGGLVGQPNRMACADEAEYERLLQEIGPPLLRGEAVDVEFNTRRRNGEPFVVRLRAKAIDPQNPGINGTIWISEDVTLARRAEQDLAGARDAAQAANRAKSTFLANASHEIRTPLSGVLGLARLASAPGLSAERQRLLLAQISESAEQLAATLTDILDVAKIEAGKLQLEAAPFDLHVLLHALRQGFAPLAASQGLTFEAQIDPTLPAWVQGDALRLRQIVANFLNNALKFTASGGIRLVVLSRPDNSVRLEVHDTGLGIDPATQARLFEPFTQADESTTRHYGGTGLGLSICRELAQLMGGSVGLNSQPGQGSCFYAELPLKPLPPLAQPAAPQAEQTARLRGARLLLVEDNAVNMIIAVAVLEQWGVQVTEASAGPQALAAVAELAAAGQRFDAVLMDLQMPGMSGYETTLALRATPGGAGLPVIALTAAALVSERERAAAIGMTDFLTKPIDPLRLQAVLLRALGGRADTTPTPLA